MAQVAMQNRGSSQMRSGPQLTGQNARPGPADVSTMPFADMERAYRAHYVPPSNAYPEGAAHTTGTKALDAAGNTLPYWINRANGPPVPYAVPTAAKDDMMIRQEVHRAADDALERGGASAHVVRTDPIRDSEIEYVKHMRDQAELAKFDDYVETLIDPRLPGNMKWLMEVYPDYVNRRLQQAHTDYEYSLRNQMIDSWGINTFEDLHFKYLVDQEKISGPMLTHGAKNYNDTYTPGWLSPWNFQTPSLGEKLRLPYASARYGNRPSREDKADWTIDRSDRPLGRGNYTGDLARGMYGLGGVSQTIPSGGAPGGGLFGGS